MSNQACRGAERAAHKAGTKKPPWGRFFRPVGWMPTDGATEVLGEYDYKQSTIATQYTRPGEANAQI